MYKTKYERIKDFLVERNVPNFRFDQIAHSVFKDRISEFERMTALPKQLRTELATEFGKNILTIKSIVQSESEQATKHLFEMLDGQRVETVAMKYRAGWESFCISSQSGCGLACAFCATGAIGLKRNLSADEITDQVLFFHLLGQDIDSISFMGMGEPFANPETFQALSLLTAKSLFSLSPRRITISTVGLVPGIRKLTEEFPQVNLVFSLHSPFDEQRSELVPLNRTYPIRAVMPVLDEHIRRTNRQVSLAYMLISGVNDTHAHAKGVISLLKQRSQWSYLYHVNLIRYNPAVGAPREFGSPEKTNVDRFFHWLKDAEINVTVRQSFGVNINAACGQLYGRYGIKGSPSGPEGIHPVTQTGFPHAV